MSRDVFEPPAGGGGGGIGLFGTPVERINDWLDAWTGPSTYPGFFSPLDPTKTTLIVYQLVLSSHYIEVDVQNTVTSYFQTYYWVNPNATTTDTWITQTLWIPPGASYSITSDLTKADWMAGFGGTFFECSVG
jgi:hypothetical protein